MFLHAPPYLQQLLSTSREKNERLARLHSGVRWLGSHNDTLAARLEEANARADQVTPLEARIHELEQELARTTGERDAQRAAADQKAQELVDKTLVAATVRSGSLTPSDLGAAEEWLAFSASVW